jgi:hypothetical protein
LTSKTHPLAVLVSHDCDVAQDFDERREKGDATADAKCLPNLLFCEVTDVPTMRAQGGPLRGTDLWKPVEQNKSDRYQFLAAPTQSEEAAGKGIPALVIDFRRHFSVPTSDVYRQLQSGTARARCHLADQYREHLQWRFASYQCRIALPVDHHRRPVEGA